MCGRYFVDNEMWREIRKICRQMDDAKLKVTAGDVRPTDMAVVLTGMKHIQLEKMQWGFTRQDHPGLLINARAETVLDASVSNIYSVLFILANHPQSPIRIPLRFMLMLCCRTIHARRIKHL